MTVTQKKILSGTEQRSRLVNEAVRQAQFDLLNLKASNMSLTVPAFGFDVPINLGLAASVASNILTVAVKGANGSDPSATNPVLIPFRNATIATGTPSWVSITAPLSMTTNAVGATLGVPNATPFRLRIGLFNNGGTAVLALYQSVGWSGSLPISILVPNEANVASTTGISGSATSASTFYTPNGTSLSSKAFRIIGYMDWASGLATAGTYATGPTTTTVAGYGIKNAGEIMQLAYVNKIDTFTSTTTGALTDITGLTTSMAPTSAPNIIRVRAKVAAATDTGGNACAFALLRGSTNIGGGTAASNRISSFGGVVRTTDTNSISAPSIEYLDAPGTTNATTYKVQFELQATGTVYINRGASDGDAAGIGRYSSHIALEEIMV